MEKQPLISIIVPIFNAEKFIAEAVESVLNQTYPYIELLLVNDGSSDSTRDICREYAEKSEKIIYFEKSNSGVSDTRNFGIEHARGEWIIFLDADDSIPKNAIEIFVSELLECDCDAIFAGHRNIYGSISINRLMRLPNGIYTYEDLKDRLLDDGTLTGILFGSVGGACYKTTFLKEKQLRFRSEVKVNEDGLFNIEFLHSRGTVKVIDRIVYNYRQWKNSKKIPLQKDKRFETSEPIIARVIEQFEEKEIYNVQLKRRRVSVTFWNALRVQNANTDYLQCRRYLQSLFDTGEIGRCYSYLDYQKINIYKKVMCLLMERKLYFLFFICVKYIKPFFSKILKR